MATNDVQDDEEIVVVTNDDEITFREDEIQLLFYFHLRMYYTNNCLFHSRIWGHMVGGLRPK